MKTSDALLKRLIPITKDILQKQMNCSDEPQVLVFDRQTDLSCLIASAYSKNMPNAEKIDFDTENPKEIAQKLFALPAGATVILVQSSNFRLDDFRIRLQLFNAGIGCLEHSHLEYFYEEEYETYIDAMEYRGDYYKKFGGEFAEKLENCSAVEVISKDGSILTFGQMEEAKVNHGVFWEQKNRGGAAICGEVFSEAKDFSTVNGEMQIRCYPGEDWRIIPCDPFTVKISESILTCDDPKCPPDFRENVLDKIAESEDNEVMIREAGFGLNSAISFERPLADVSAFERMAGFHVSLGKKHNIYRNKIHKSVTQRYHMDVFANTREIRIDSEVIFSGGGYKIQKKYNNDFFRQKI